MNLQLTDVQKVSFQLQAVDAKGNPTGALASGQTIVVNSSDTDMATVVPDPTPASGSVASGFIVAGSKLGTVQITAQVSNADGSAAESGSTSIDIISSAAATIQFALGTPQ